MRNEKNEKVYDRFKALLEDVKRKEGMKHDLEKIQEAIKEYDACNTASFR